MSETVTNTVDLVHECAENPALYYHAFFPGTFRQPTPLFHHDIFKLLDSPSNRYVAVKVFRGGAKTTILRAYCSRRIAYGISRVIMFVSASQDYSKKSVQWLRKLFDSRAGRRWRETFNLTRGSKWTDDLIEIQHGVLDIPITVIAVGITGQIRGLNIDDYRPDLIVVDDPCDEENTGTPEQREKLRLLFFGALERSLAPATECPEAKMVLLQTPLNADDLVHTCEKDSTWTTVTHGAFNDQGHSTWPDRFPTETLQAWKQAYIDRGQLALWLREMECRIVGGGDLDFRGEWLQYWESPPDCLATYGGIDPAPPPSDKAIILGMGKRDFEVIAIVGTDGESYYLLDYAMSRGHDPGWTITNFFRLVEKWRPLKFTVESVAYQRTLRWILEQAMKERKVYIQIDDLDDRRKKRYRIQQAFSGIGSQKRFFVHRSHTAFIEQFSSYPDVEHEDVLDAVAIALIPALEGVALGLEDRVEKEMAEWRTAP